MSKEIKIGCIGCGMMGGALIKAIAKKVGGEKILLSDGDVEKAKFLALELGANFATSNAQIIENCSHIILAVKPAFFSSVLEQIKDSYNNIAKSEQKNLPATVNEGMIALCTKENVSSEISKEVEFVKEILSCAGKVEQVSEKLMDVVTAVSGSGPAYGFMFIEALADAAVLLGMPRSQSYIYAAQTLKGAAQMVLETSEHPAKLKDAVCSPGGTTIQAVKSLEEKGFRSAVISAVESAYNKSVDLGK